MDAATSAALTSRGRRRMVSSDLRDHWRAEYDLSHREDDLAEQIAVDHPAEPPRGLGEGHLAVDDRTDAAGHKERQQLLELAAVAHRRPEHVDLGEEDAREVGLDAQTAGAAADDDASAGAGRPDRVVPGRLAHAVDDGVDPAGQPGTCLERGVRSEVERPLALVLAAAGRPDLPAARA